MFWEDEPLSIKSIIINAMPYISRWGSTQTWRATLGLLFGNVCIYVFVYWSIYIYRYIYHTYVNMCIIPSKTLFYCFVPFVKFQVWRLVAMSLMEGTRKCRTKAHSCQGSAIGGYRALLPVEFLMDRGMGGNCSSQRWWRCELSLHRGEEGREGNSGDSRGQISRTPKSRMQVGTSPLYAPCFYSVG